MVSEIGFSYSITLAFHAFALGTEAVGVAATITDLLAAVAASIVEPSLEIGQTGLIRGWSVLTRGYGFWAFFGTADTCSEGQDEEEGG